MGRRERKGLWEGGIQEVRSGIHSTIMTKGFGRRSGSQEYKCIHLPTSEIILEKELHVGD